MDHSRSFATRLLEHLVTPTFVLNLRGEVIVWNKACEVLTGIDGDDLIGTKEHWRAFYSEKRETLADVVLSGNEKKLQQLYASHLISEGEIINTIHAENWATMPALHKEKYLSIDAGPVFNESGELEAVVETLSDLTELKKLQESLTALATLDSLTGLGNRRLFDGQLHNHWYAARRHRDSLSLLLIDIDYFKRYNDLYGHPKGDQILAQAGSILTEIVLRGSDECFRYGGEEFAILLPSTDEQGALDVAERVREQFFELNILHEGSTHFRRLTVSVGSASTLPDAQNDPNDLIKNADAALYDAKAMGRNRIAVYRENSD